jgi:predicted aldo/keto reductase-like oxidoreductase
MRSDLEIYLSALKEEFPGSNRIAKRDFLPGVSVSIVGAGALMLCGLAQKEADRLVSESVALGIDYFDAAPSYGSGEAEEKLGHALQPHRDRVFLAGKTLQRSAAAARADLEQSLRRLRTATLDLYQFHAVNTTDDLARIFATDGALSALIRAQREGLIRHIGFSSHSVPLALAMMERFKFDSILFPVNFVCYERGNFGAQVIKNAHRLGIARVALKALAQCPWRGAEERTYPNCWYRPIDDPPLVLQAMRFTLSEQVSALLPPADARLYRMALALAPYVTPLTSEQRRALLDRARSLKPIMTAKKRS